MEFGPFPLAQSGAKNDAANSERTAKLRALSKEFEAVFLHEMLKNSGINKTSAAFGGGAGEEAFGSVLTQEYANLLSERGGIGIAEHVFRAMSERGGKV